LEVVALIFFGCFVVVSDHITTFDEGKIYFETRFCCYFVGQVWVSYMLFCFYVSEVIFTRLPVLEPIFGGLLIQIKLWLIWVFFLRYNLRFVGFLLVLWVCLTGFIFAWFFDLFRVIYWIGVLFLSNRDLVWIIPALDNFLSIYFDIVSWGNDCF